MPHMHNSEYARQAGQGSQTPDVTQVYDRAYGAYQSNVVGKKPAPAMREPKQTPSYR
jgi:hypothetical protein